jgi:hypothetical protein
MFLENTQLHIHALGVNSPMVDRGQGCEKAEA